MLLCNLFMLTLIFNQLIGHLDAFSCPKGHRVADKHGKKSCEPCPKGFFQDAENSSQSCQGCTVCNEKYGSFTKTKCTSVANTVCQCREGYVSAVPDSALCRCGPGFEIAEGGVCSKCKDGYFSPDGKRCQKWKECKATGVKIPGSTSSDVVCNEELKSNTTTTTASKSITRNILTVKTSHRPHEGDQTLKTQSTTSTTSPPNNNPPSNTSHHAGVIILCLAIAGLLVWTVITCKMHMTPCWPKKKMQTKDSICRRPIEESGDGSETLFKVNLEP